NHHGHKKARSFEYHAAIQFSSPMSHCDPVGSEPGLSTQCRLGCTVRGCWSVQTAQHVACLGSICTAALCRTCV
ncbi:hypothetical protein BaRGS_00032044, partial [Batillaria attramentaria]